ncbi:DNA-binding protein RFX2-like isoform X2 [Corticium candelabrum]|nr:DNA-binding protein RFX2-like isoform X2 [Corticium candelabrum]XP_062509387.1 DNA-binding protein RFX2-like isoform X2 [Corticium candelabrum]XP_062509388.1 DNA-binding protein RFX2-like isoform X2 [Corticium candelabrum]
MSETGNAVLSASSPQPSPTQQPGLSAQETAHQFVQSQSAVVHLLPNQHLAQTRPEMVVVPSATAAPQSQPTVVQFGPGQPKAISIAQFSQSQHKSVPVIDNSVAEALINNGKVIVTFADASSLQQSQPSMFGSSAPISRPIPALLVTTPQQQQQQHIAHLPPPSASFLHSDPQGFARHPHTTPVTRAAPQTVQWLVDNYETAEGASLPRCLLYNHYMKHCQATGLEAINAATFGKLIRSVFLGLRTRRLGTRGNSKYHYYGIRVKPNSPLNSLLQEEDMVARQPTQMQQAKRYKDGNEVTAASTGGSSQQSDPQSHHSAHMDYLGPVNPVLPPFGEIEASDVKLLEGLTENDLSDFTAVYREHCEAVMDVIVNLQFNLVEPLWSNFWGGSGAGCGELSSGGDLPMSMEASLLDTQRFRLPKGKLVLLCDIPEVVHYLQQCDYMLYQTIMETLIPDVLKPIPGSLTQSLRTFAKNLESWMKLAVKELPSKFVTAKVSAVVAFGQNLRRYTSLNHLAQAARAVLQNSQQITQMLVDLNRVDFNNIQEQAAWVCQCEDTTIQQIQQDFKQTLQQQNSIEQWALWLDGIVGRTLQQYEEQPSYSKAARQFLLKWSFYSSLIIRDLTLRSAASFGSFHLIRLLFDEYMFYLVEHRIAMATQQVPLAVMAEYVGLSDQDFTQANDITNGRPEVNGKERSDNGDDAAASFLSGNTGEDETPAKRARLSEDAV